MTINLLKSKDMNVAKDTHFVYKAAAFIALLLLVAFPVSAAKRYSMTLTVTNLPVTSNTLVFSAPASKTITWTNNTSSTLVTTNTSIGGAATNLYLQIAAYAIGSPRLFPEFSSSNVIVLSGENDQLITAVATNNGLWASITYSTNTISAGVAVTVQQGGIAGIGTTNTPTWIASQAIQGFSDLSTNSFSTNAQAMANYLSKGIPYGGGTQVVSSEIFAHKISGTNIGRIVGGHYSSPFLSNPTMTNGANYGNAFRSPGAGSQSDQFGSGAVAGGQYGLAIGTSAYSGTNLGSMAIGNSATVFYNPANRHGELAVAIGTSTRASGTNCGALFAASISDYNESYAIAGTTTADNQIRIGGANSVNHWVSIPGVLQAAGISNVSVTAGSSNVMKGSYAWPSSAFSTLGNGNNIAVNFGSNYFIRITGTVTSSPAICGISGGQDGLSFCVKNELGYTLTLTENTIDPTPANRFDFLDNTDVNVVNGGFAWLKYNANASRWNIDGLYPPVSSATNGSLSALSVSGSASVPTNTANFSIATNDFVLNQYYTNVNQRAWVTASVSLTNILAADISKVALYVDQAADGTFEQTGTEVHINGVALSSSGGQLSFFLQPGARFVFTNLTGGTGAASINAMSSQWVKQ